MNRKDIVSLMEACEQIGVGKLPIEKEIGDIKLPIGNEDETSISSGPKISVEETPEINVDYAELKDLGERQQKMTISNLQSLKSHAYEILSILDNGVLVEPWMDDKITIATDYIINVANSLIYRK